MLGCGSGSVDSGSGPATGGGPLPDGAMGTGASGGFAGASSGTSAGSSGSAGAGGAPENDGETGSAGNTTDGGGPTDGGVTDGGGSGDGSMTSPFICLPNGEEKLIVEITGMPSFSVATPTAVTCLSRYLPAAAASDPIFDLNWNAPDGLMSVIVRTYKPTPGQTGTFTPFSILISKGSDAWLSRGDMCHLNVASSTKIGEIARTATIVDEIYKVAGSMTCDLGWASLKPTDKLEKFEFATRVTSTKTR